MDQDHAQNWMDAHDCSDLVDGEVEAPDGDWVRAYRDDRDGLLYDTQDSTPITYKDWTFDKSDLVMEREAIMVGSNGHPFRYRHRRPLGRTGFIVGLHLRQFDGLERASNLMTGAFLLGLSSTVGFVVSPVPPLSFILFLLGLIGWGLYGTLVTAALHELFSETEQPSGDERDEIEPLDDREVWRAAAEQNDPRPVEALLDERLQSKEKYGDKTLLVGTDGEHLLCGETEALFEPSEAQFKTALREAGEYDLFQERYDKLEPA